MLKIFLYNDFPHGSCGIQSENDKNHIESITLFDIVTDPKVADIIIFFDYNGDKRIKKFINLYLDKFLVLIRTEPPSIIELQYKIKLPFNLVLDLGKINFVNGVLLYIEWPISPIFFEKRITVPAIDESKVVFVNSNKFGNRNYYYHLRRSIVYKLNSSVKSFGEGWSIFDFKYRNFIGNLIHNVVRFRINEILLMNPFVFNLFSSPKSNILSKVDLLAYFNYVLVIENDNTYMSEKLIEALLLDKSVIYIGGSTSHLPLEIQKNILEPDHSLNRIDLLLKKILVDGSGPTRLSINDNNPSDNSLLLHSWKANEVWTKVLKTIIQNYSLFKST